MSTSERCVVLETDNPQAELLLVDGDFRIVARGPSPLRVSVPLGLYAAKAKVGDEESENLFRVVAGANDMSVHISAPRFESPVPLVGTSTSREYHVAAAERFLLPGEANVKLGGNSELMICIRDPSHRNFTVAAAPSTSAERKAYQLSFRGFRILNTEGSLVVDLDQSAEHNITDGFTAVTAELTDGPYVLAHGRDCYSSCFSIPSAAGWTLQCYINLVPSSREGGALIPDLMGMALMYGRMEEGFNPWRPDVIAAETIRKGMVEGRNHIDTPNMRALLSEKFQNPMLGLYAAHLLLEADSPDYELIGIVIRNTQLMLGLNHPDVVALACEYLRRRGVPANVDRPGDLAYELLMLKGPPILTRSWDLLLKAAAETPASILEKHPAFIIARNAIGRGVYLNWLERKPESKDIPAKNVSVIGLNTMAEDRVDARDLAMLANNGQLLRFLGNLISSAGTAFSTAVHWAKKMRQGELGSAKDGSPLANEIANIKTNQDAARVLCKLASSYEWKKIVPAIRRTPDWLKNISGLQGELIFLLRDVSGDDDATRAIDEAFIQRLLEARRVPLISLSEAIADIELGGWVASGLYNMVGPSLVEHKPPQD